MVSRPRLARRQFDHRADPLRRHAMRAVNQIARRDDAGPHVMLFEPRARIGRHLAVEGDVTALGRDDDFLALDLARRDQLAEHLADLTFAALEAIVHRRIDQVDAAAQARRVLLHKRRRWRRRFRRDRCRGRSMKPTCRALAESFPADRESGGVCGGASAVARPLSIMRFPRAPLRAYCCARL